MLDQMQSQIKITWQDFLLVLEQLSTKRKCIKKMNMPAIMMSPMRMMNNTLSEKVMASVSSTARVYLNTFLISYAYAVTMNVYGVTSFNLYYENTEV